MCGFGATDLVVLRRGAVDCACSAVTCAVSVLGLGGAQQRRQHSALGEASGWSEVMFDELCLGDVLGALHASGGGCRREMGCSMNEAVSAAARLVCWCM